MLMPSREGETNLLVPFAAAARTKVGVTGSLTTTG